jgi:phytoene dehydrogenase-like protein
MVKRNDMKNDYDAIIIGSGVGGSAVGALLAHAGWKVLILEKNKVIGGRCTSPTNYDPSLAPQGRQLIFFGTGCPPKQDWKQWEKALLHSFYTVYPQAREKVMWYRIDTPDVVNGYAGEEGNIIGVAQTVDQIHERRPTVTSPLDGLYFASAEAGGHGIGAELAADSARELFRVLTSG